MHYSCIQSVLELIGTHAKDITSFCPSITLSAPEPDDPQDAVVAQQVQFVAIVCHWLCIKYLSWAWFICSLKCDISQRLFYFGYCCFSFQYIDFLFPVKYFHISTWYLWILQYLRDYQTFVGTARYWTETLLPRPHRLGSRKR